MVDPKRYPQTISLESLYKMCIRGSDQLKTVLVFFEQEVKQQNLQQSLPEIGDHGEEMHGSESQSPKIFEARRERIVTGVPVKTRKGKLVSVERKQGKCYRWKAKGQCTNENA